MVMDTSCLTMIILCGSKRFHTLQAFSSETRETRPGAINPALRLRLLNHLAIVKSYPGGIGGDLTRAIISVGSVQARSIFAIVRHLPFQKTTLCCHESRFSLYFRPAGSCTFSTSVLFILILIFAFDLPLILPSKFFQPPLLRHIPIMHSRRRNLQRRRLRPYKLQIFLRRFK